MALTNPQEASPPSINLVHQRNELVPFLGGDLVHADRGNSGQVLMQQTLFDDPGHGLADVVPAHPEGLSHVAPGHPLCPGSRKAYHRRRHRRVSLSPWHLLDAHSAIGATDASRGIQQIDHHPPEWHEQEGSFRLSVEEALDIQAFGFYQPRYGFESSAQYVVRLKVVRDEQQALLKADTATHCATEWKVGGSAAEGRKMVKNQSKLMLRAFNGECDAAIAKVKYDNVTAMEERITKSSEAVNKLGLVQHVSITNRYFGLKLAELRLVHEHREKVQQEKDEQRRVKEQMREEQQAQAEIDRAKADAEKEEAVSTAALAKAKAELSITDAAGKQHEKLEALVVRLETELTGALDRKAKAIARAQLTRSGHVYVLSNIGSFGDGIYKIGMTRRLEPLERVDELGDASVPFPFDVHAIIYSEDAPQLEHSLHKAFAARRVNMVNHRKEYFRVTLDDIRDAVQKLHGLVTFLLVAEAEEYRKTRAAIDAPPADPATAGLPLEPAAATE